MRRAQLLPSCAIAATFIIACADEPHDANTSIYAAGNTSGETGEGPAESSENDPNDPNDPFPDDGESGTTDDSGDSSDDPDEGAPIKLDTILDDDPPDPEPTHCGVDILFVIDNSGSMSKHKTEFVEAFDGFIDEMIGALVPGTPVHIGVTRATGFYSPGNGSGWSDPSCDFGFLDGSWTPPTLTQNGINGQQGRLFEHDGKRFFEYDIGDDPTMLGEWFESTLYDAIQLDLASNTESVVAAAAYPFHPINAEHNAGFLREKAVLVLFLLSDAPDSTPAEIPTSEFIDLVSTAKSGCGDGCILPTGIIQANCYDKPNNVNKRLTEFMNGFGAPPAALDFFTMNEAPASFTSVFGATLAETIAYTCEHVVPVE